MNPIINSILDTDIYLFSMQSAICKLYPYSLAKYKFINRGKSIFPSNMAEELKKQIQYMSKLQLTKEEKDFLKSTCYYLNPVYLDFLSGYRFDPDEVSITQENGELNIEIMGPFYRTILWETPLMATISELGFTLDNILISKNTEQVAKEKAEKLSSMKIKYADFGTRRRFSQRIQETTLRTMKNVAPKNFFGTSNPDLARRIGDDMVVVGTQAHAYTSFHAAKYGYRMANEMAMESWIDVFGGSLGICLPDTFTTDVFLQSFTTKYAKLFDGCRGDSGSPIEFANKIINHYKKLKIDPSTKSIIFSDNLNSYEKIQEILDWHSSLEEKPKILFCIGTWISNDVGAKPYNMVIKLVAAKPNGLEWIETCKLSDTQGKYTGSNSAVELCKKSLGIKD